MYTHKYTWLPRNPKEGSNCYPILYTLFIPYDENQRVGSRKKTLGTPEEGSRSHVYVHSMPLRHSEQPLGLYLTNSIADC